MPNLMEQLASRVRAIETDEPPVVYNLAAAAVTTPPTQLELDAAFGATAAQLRDGWSGVVYDAGAGTVWLAVSSADLWWVIGGGGGAGVPHNLLGPTHPDTDPAAPVQGDIIRGNATPHWERYPIGAHWQILGVDAGGTLPEWQSFDWDFHVIAAGGDGVHDHSNASEGGTLPVGSITAHNLLSLQHGDTLASAVSRGSLIYGNNTPAWAELAHPAAANSLLTTDANDVLWSTYFLSGTAGQNYVLSATGGTVPTGTGASPQVAYWNGVNTLAGDAGMTYDAANDLLTLTGASATRAILQSADAATVTATFPLRLDHVTSNVAAVGFGVGAEAYLEASDGNDYLAGSIAWLYSTAAVATRRSRIELRVNYSGTDTLAGVIVAATVTVAGNARGAGAYDFQSYRDANTQVASGTNSCIFGGIYNTSSATSSTVFGGQRNTASSQYALVAGGINNIASGSQSTVVGGQSNEASGNSATAVGGYINIAAGDYSFAAGYRANTGANAGVFCWADNAIAAAFTATTANQFAARCNGGAWFNATDLAATPGVFNLLTLEGRVTGIGAGAVGDGTGILFKFESATNGSYRDQAKIGAAWSDATDATRTSYLSFYAVNSAAASAEYMRIAPNLITGYASTALTNTINYSLDLQHATSGAAAALFGLGQRHYLEDSAGNSQVASETATLWAAATSGSESPLYRGTTYPAGTAGPGYWGFWTWTGVDGTSRVMIPNGTGDVTECITIMYTVSAVTAGDAMGSMITLEPGDTGDIYSDGTDTCTITVNANGEVSVARSAGADSFDVSFLATWH